MAVPASGRKAGRPENPQNWIDLADRALIGGHINSFWNIRKRQRVAFDNVNLFLDPEEFDAEDEGKSPAELAAKYLSPKRNDHPMVQLLKQLAVEFHKVEPEDLGVRMKLLEAMQKAASDFDKAYAATVSDQLKLVMIQARKGAGGDGDDPDDPDAAMRKMRAEGLDEDVIRSILGSQYVPLKDAR